MTNRILLIIALMLTIIVLASFLIFRGEKHQTQTQQPPIPIEQLSSPTPSTFQIPATTSAIVKSFTVEKVEPVQNVSVDYSPITPIEVSFNDAVDIGNLEITTVPNTPITIFMQKENTVRLTPKSAWEIGITIITIQKQTTSINGVPLPENYVYRIKTAWPKNPPADDHDY